MGKKIEKGKGLPFSFSFVCFRNISPQLRLGE